MLMASNTSEIFYIYICSFITAENVYNLKNKSCDTDHASLGDPTSLV